MNTLEMPGAENKEKNARERLLDLMQSSLKKTYVPDVLAYNMGEIKALFKAFFEQDREEMIQSSSDAARLHFEYNKKGGGELLDEFNGKKRGANMLQSMASEMNEIGILLNQYAKDDSESFQDFRERLKLEAKS